MGISRDLSEQQREAASFSHGRLHRDVPAVPVHYLLAKAEPDARTGRFGGEEGDENLVLHFRQDAVAVVADGDKALPGEDGLHLHFYPGRCLLAASLFSVLEQVNQHLLYLQVQLKPSQNYLLK